MTEHKINSNKAVGVSNNPTTHNESEDKKMERECLLNIFYDNIDRLNTKACGFINSGENKKAIEIYFKKIDYIRYSYEFDIIDLRCALTMSDDARRLINLLEDTNDGFEVIRIPINASNLDVLRNVFNCKVVSENENFMHIDIDRDTGFRKSWLKTKYKGGSCNETD